MKQLQSSFLIALLFVVLYGSGFVGAKMGLPFASPLWFLTVRFIVTCVILLVIISILKAKWPTSLMQYVHLSIAGLLLVATFSAGVFIAINLGVSPAISALIIALQPITVALGSGPMLGEHVSGRQWLGFLIGIIGVAMVVGEKLHFQHGYWVGILLCVVGLLGLSIGNLYQKKFCTTTNVFTCGFVQSFASFVAMLVLGLIFEPYHVQWTGEFIFALVWMSVIVSIGALSLLYILIRRGSANQVASIFYLVPVVAAIVQYLIYGTILTPLEIIGMVVVILGVVIVNRKKVK